MRVRLASGSPRRLELLHQMGAEVDASHKLSSFAPWQLSPYLWS